MRAREFIKMVFALAKRASLHGQQFHCLSFVEFSNAAVRPGCLTRSQAEAVDDFLKTCSLELVEYALCIRRQQNGSNPRGTRLGKLEFAPIVQLAKRTGHQAFAQIAIPHVPKTRNELFEHFDALLGCPECEGDIAQLRTLFDFEVKDYVTFLVAQRDRDPALFLMLLAHEFKLARAWSSSDPELLAHIEDGAKLAELCRLIDMIRFLDGKRLNVDQVRAGIKALCRPNGPKKKEQVFADLAKPWIEQASYGVEALRAAFIGDMAGAPMAPAGLRSNMTPAMQARVVARCALFAECETLPATQSHAPRKRFARGRRAIAYSYYGIDLGRLLMVGLRDLSRSCGQPGGANSVIAFAREIVDHLREEGDYPKGLKSERDSTTAAMYARVYLDAAGIDESAGQFDHRHWFGSPKDDTLYAWLYDLLATPTELDVRKARTVRAKIRFLSKFLLGTIGPRWKRSGRVDAALVNATMSQLACSLNPVTMDPIFCALVERSIVECGFETDMRKDPVRVPSARVRKRTARVFRRNAFRIQYARFTDPNGRPNH